MFWVGVCLGLGLIGVEISMVVGNFVGVILGLGWVSWGGRKWVKGLVLVEGRGSVAYPNFFLEIPSNFGNYPHISV